MERRTIEAVLAGAEWLTGDEVGHRHNVNAKNRRAAVSRWLSDGKVFAIERAGQRLFPAYVFDELYKPRPVIATVLEVLDAYTTFRIASWFESTNAFLGGRRPREVVSVDPEPVLEAARDHVTGPIHG